MPVRAAKKPNDYTCFIKELPKELRIAAAQEAIRENPANKPMVQSGVMAATLFTGVEDNEEELKAQFLAGLTGQLWPASGVDLTVSFMDNPPQALIDKILQIANDWGNYGNVKFRHTIRGGQVRIARSERAYYSYLGRTILRVSSNQHTMMLGGITNNTSLAELIRVVKHEFGHTLGLVHEHLRRAVIELLDVNKTLALFRREQGWDDATIWANVLTPEEENTLTASPVADVTSIMAYFLSGAITKNGKSIPGGNDLSPIDKETIARIYPKEIKPPPGITELIVTKPGRYVLQEG